jgi:ribosomal protein S27AE
VIREVADREPYNEYATCPKCGAGSIRITTKYRSMETDRINIFGHSSPNWFGDPAMERVCGRCEFRWFQRPRDEEA